MHLAYFSPLPPQRSGIAAYSARLLPELSRLLPVTAFVTHPPAPTSALPEAIPVRDSAEFGGPAAGGFHACLYQMGNNLAYHAGIYGQLRRHPGFVVLHDLNIYAFHTEYYLASGKRAGFTREMAFAYGTQGLHHARSILRGDGRHQLDNHPLFERIVQTSLGCIVHSQFARRRVQAHCPGIPVTAINQPVPLPDASPPSSAARASLGLAPDGLLLASFGFMAPQKRIDVVLRTLAELGSQLPPWRYFLVGQVVAGYDIQAQVDTLGLSDRVTLAGYVDDDQLATYLAAVDVGINLRYPTSGETSATLLSLMAAGKPTIVTDVDAFSELPDSACIKISADPEDEEAQLAQALSSLMGDDQKRRMVGTAGQTYIKQTCAPGEVARQYVSFMNAAVNQSRLSASQAPI